MKGFRIKRGIALLLAWVGFFCLTGWAQPVQTQITFEAIIQKAQERAGKPFQPPKADLPEFLTQLNYDTYREIQFRHDQALWKKEELPFRLEFYHPGYLYLTPVKMHEFTATHAQPIRFVEDFFEYGKFKSHKKISPDSGYAGLKLLFRLNSAENWDEVASFLGSSYFRMLGKGQRYGASARGLAFNTGEANPAEEFPVFTEWWISKPEKGAATLRLYGLLESPHCAGAFEFLLRPGETTFADVNAALFLRDHNGLKTIGIAPLTSMFWFGENTERKPDDYRGEVHDSDGLLMREGDEYFWRPLDNPPAVRHQVFPAKGIKGFGLLQRDREFRSYQDIFNSYEKVPSVWVEPRGNWGEGEVHLVELPTNFEGTDNIVAFWNPKQKPAPMQPYRYAYTLHWTAQPEAKVPVFKVMQTRIGADPREPKKRQVSIDFGGQKLDKQPEIVARSGENATVADTQIFRNEVGQSWRVIFSLTPKAGNPEPVDIECVLKAGATVISETWKYQWNQLSSGTPPK